ncbi:hypothetical protein ACFKHW_28375 [Bradyrhizobium lupini]|uniref:hypothetical protein n=1 Tax=Rhizobium lupini TaxID=136996 RepID=UPI0036714C69
MPGGGLSPDSARWIASRPNFFLAAKPLARLTFTIPACTALARPIMEELSFGLLQTFAINVIHFSYLIASPRSSDGAIRYRKQSTMPLHSIMDDQPSQFSVSARCG